MASHDWVKVEQRLQDHLRREEVSSRVPHCEADVRERRCDLPDKGKRGTTSVMLHDAELER